jgi:drug/metabolite transporter (DMT)-like permease
MLELPIVLGLISAVLWGSGDFVGGMAARRLPALQVTFWVNALGIVLFSSMALIAGEVFVPKDTGWAIAAGSLGALGLTSLYKALSVGQMGVVAPVAAVMSAAIPVVAGSLLEGLPKPLQFGGFALGLLGVWLVSYSGQIRAGGLGLALLAGVGFGSSFVCVDQVSGVFWPSAVIKITAFTLIALGLSGVGYVRRGQTSIGDSKEASRAQETGLRWPPAKVVYLLLGAGVLDALGSLFFLLSSQAGRLDVAGVVSSLYPAATVVWAWLILRERLNPGQWLGIGSIFGAIALIAGG